MHSLTRSPNQRPIAPTPSPLPLILRDDSLGELNLTRLVPEQIVPEDVLPDGRAVIEREVQRQGRAGVPVPDLGGVDAVPVGELVGALQEVVDGGADGPVRARHQGGVPERLVEVPLLAAGRQVEERDYFLCCVLLRVCG